MPDGGREAVNEQRTFPIQDGPAIPWWLAEVLYVKAGQIWHGDQSLERLAERGGWGRGELGHLLVGLAWDGRHVARGCEREMPFMSEVDRLTQELMEMESRYHLQRGRRGEAEQRAERAERALRRAEGRLNVIRMTLLPQLTAQADYAQAALAALSPTVQQPREERER